MRRTEPSTRLLLPLFRSHCLVVAHRLPSSSFLGLPCSILYKYKPQEETSMEPMGSLFFLRAGSYRSVQGLPT